MKQPTTTFRLYISTIYLEKRFNKDGQALFSDYSIAALNEEYLPFLKNLKWEGDRIHFFMGEELEDRTTLVGDLGERIYLLMAYPQRRPYPNKDKILLHFWIAAKIGPNSVVLLEKLAVDDKQLKTIYEKNHIKMAMESNMTSMPPYLYQTIEDASLLIKCVQHTFQTKLIYKSVNKILEHYEQFRMLIESDTLPLSHPEMKAYFLLENNSLNNISANISDALSMVQKTNKPVDPAQFRKMVGLRLIRIMLTTLAAGDLIYVYYTQSFSYYDMCCSIEIWYKRINEYIKSSNKIESDLEIALKLEAQREVLRTKALHIQTKIAEIEQRQDYTNLSETLSSIFSNEPKQKLGSGKETNKVKSIYNHQSDEMRSLRPKFFNDRIDELVEELADLPKYHAEYAPKKTLLQYLVNLPFKTQQLSLTKVKNVQEALDSTHYGHNEIKKEITEYIFELLHSKEEERALKTICLVGAPGIGKSSIVKSISKGLGRPLIRLSMGGVDSKYLVGHSQTYVNAKPGIIIEEMSKLKYNNPIILIDEIDKVPIRDSPYGVLMEILDPTLSKTFKDHYVNMPYNLSNALIICTANVASDIESALLNRMVVYELDSYTTDEKMLIAQNYIWPSLVRKFGSLQSLSLSEDCLREIIMEYTYEGGVRDLTTILNKLYIRNLQLNETQEVKIDHIDNLQTISELQQKGVKVFDTAQYARYLSKDTMIGLYVDGLGLGGIITISTYRTMSKNNFDAALLVNTSTNDSTTKISSMISYRYICKLLNLHSQEYKHKMDISFSPIAIPVSGTSAGLTMAIAFYKSIRGLHGKYAATGELDLNGYVGAVGGIKAKILGAQSYNVRTIFIPKSNERDYNKIKHLLLPETKVYLVEHFVETVPVLLKINDNYK